MPTIILTGDGFNNLLVGLAGADYRINGLGGNDTLFGNSGNDTLDGGTGNDSMNGGTGSDVYIVDSAADIVTESVAAGGGIDRVESSVSWSLGANVENLTLTGTANISGYGNSLANVMIGNAGNNWLDGGTGADQMSGGAGNDTYVVDNAGDVVTELLGGGTSDGVRASISYTLGANLENLTLTGAAAINGFGNELSNVIYGNGAANLIDGRAGADAMYGGGGNDIYVVDDVGDVVGESAAAGTDKVQSRLVDYTLTADVENLQLLDLSLSVSPGGLLLVLPAGINGNGNSLANIIDGNAASNQLKGLAGNDTLGGLGGNDTLDGGTGSDSMKGGTGDDMYIVDAAGDIVVELAGEGVDAVQSSVTHTLAAQVENLTLTGASGISGYGNTLANVITGNSAGNWIDGGTGADTMRGGAGNDYYVVDNAGDVVDEAAGQGYDHVYAGITMTLVDPDVEGLVLTGAAAINGTGNASANAIYGNGANNQLFGLAGNDAILAGGGNDTVQGGSGADTIRGGLGNDVLRAVDNVFFVDDGAADAFVFDTALNPATNLDLIDKASFTAGGGEATDDQIWLENSIFTALQSGAGTNVGTLGAGFSFEGAGLNGNQLASAAGIYLNTATGELFYNPTFGVAGDSVLFAVINTAGVAGGAAVLSAEEFTLV